MLQLVLFHAWGNVFDYELELRCSNNNTFGYYLSQRPSIYFKNNQMIIKTKDEVISCNIEDVVNYEIKKVSESSIKENSIEQISFYKNSFTLYNIGNETDLIIYDTKGCILFKKKITARSKSFIDMKNYPSGIYIISVNKVTYKYIKI